MFEAHLLDPQELLNSCSINLPCTSFNRCHSETHKPLRIWFAEGKRKNLQGDVVKAIFVYSEYRDSQGDNRFLCQRYDYPACLQQADIDRYLARAVSQPLAL
ncbi:hypothetical protein [Neptuniibacter halophilus]|uniref:hypothetical protein n=1 Tax=Neptuniibacter halophilus TaxID=651666 RepID=UPI002572E5D2|nr:hypothetical protein [Neptuniibacter halophilus]